MEIVLVALLVGSCAFLQADDEAVGVAAGGIQARKESRISMDKERLTISLEKVTVEFEFLNTTDQEVTTEVAFPVPPWEFEPIAATRNFSEFRLWVEGQRAKYQTQVRAKFKGTDYTDLLRGLGIDIRNFGNFTDDAVTDYSQLGMLPKAAREELISLGLIDIAHRGRPTWSVVQTYHWNQVFPAHKVIHIRHEYTPVTGYRWAEFGKIRSEFKDACISPSLQNKLNALVAKSPVGTAVQPAWVKYILTTANTWRTPIRDFQLTVESDSKTDQAAQFISFCWDGKVERVDKNKVMARKANFTPTHELTGYYWPED